MRKSSTVGQSIAVFATTFLVILLVAAQSISAQAQILNETRRQAILKQMNFTTEEIHDLSLTYDVYQRRQSDFTDACSYMIANDLENNVKLAEDCLKIMEIINQNMKQLFSNYSEVYDDMMNYYRP